MITLAAYRYADFLLMELGDGYLSKVTPQVDWGRASVSRL